MSARNVSKGRPPAVPWVADALRTWAMGLPTTVTGLIVDGFESWGAALRTAHPGARLTVRAGDRKFCLIVPADRSGQVVSTTVQQGE